MEVVGRQEDRRRRSGPRRRGGRAGPRPRRPSPPFMSDDPLPVRRSPSTPGGTNGRWTVSRWPLNWRTRPGRGPRAGPRRRGRRGGRPSGRSTANPSSVRIAASASAAAPARPVGLGTAIRRSGDRDQPVAGRRGPLRRSAVARIDPGLGGGGGSRRSAPLDRDGSAPGYHGRAAIETEPGAGRLGGLSRRVGESALSPGDFFC